MMRAAASNQEGRFSEVAARVAEVRARIGAVAAGRAVRIVAVTKGFGADAVDAAVAAGVTDIGENYAQELTAKASAGAGGGAARWHFIGAVQRNKVAHLAPFVAVWQTVDRAAVAEAIARHSPGATALVQVNLTGAPQRAGCGWDDVEAVVGAARRAGLTVTGLMGIGPEGQPVPELFGRLAGTAARLGLGEVSMGMSGDYEVAVAEGSTMVRLGTVLFGPRPAPADLRR
jgi:pyridoxal phosphate enzyme (YggS family)